MDVTTPDVCDVCCATTPAATTGAADNPTTPEADATTPEADPTTPEADATTPEADPTTPEADPPKGAREGDVKTTAAAEDPTTDMCSACDCGEGGDSGAGSASMSLLALLLPAVFARLL